jgi:hypothetical protein
MDIWLLLLALGVVALVVFQSKRLVGHTGSRSSRRGVSSSANAASYVRSPYRAVSIKCGDIACRQARAVRNVSYLVDEAPILPLAGCDAGKCSCKYVHHSDRRNTSLDRRRSKDPTLEESAIMGSGERRKAPRSGRRATDRKQVATG